MSFDVVKPIEHILITLLCVQLAKNGALNLKTIRHFIIDECDKVLENISEDKLCDILACVMHCVNCAVLYNVLTRIGLCAQAFDAACCLDECCVISLSRAPLD